MNPFEAFDRWWERYRQTRPQLALCDVTFDQSHTHHTHVCAIAFGGASMLAFTLLLGPGRYVFGTPLAIGISLGFLFYIIREIIARIPNWRYRWWDGWLDVQVPIERLGPWTAIALLCGVPWWSGAALYALSCLSFTLYTVGRPRGALYYGSY